VYCLFKSKQCPRRQVDKMAEGKMRRVARGGPDVTHGEVDLWATWVAWGGRSGLLPLCELLVGLFFFAKFWAQVQN